MYCTKCKFTSFDHVPSCPKCGNDWSAQKEVLNLTWIESPGFQWIKGDSAGPAVEPAAPAASMEEASFEFESSSSSQEQSGSGENLQELSFDDFEEVNLGEADAKAQKAEGSQMPEVDVESDMDDSLLGTDLGDLDNFDLELDDLQDKNGMDDADISLDELDLDLEDASGKKSRSKK